MLGAAPAEVAGSSLVPRKSEVTDSCLVCRGVGSLSATTPLYLLLQRSLPQAYSDGGQWLKPVPIDVPGLDLLLRRSLTHTQIHGGLRLRPALSKVAPLYLLLWRSLLQASFGGSLSRFYSIPSLYHNVK